MKKYTIRACRVGYIEIEAETEQEAYDQAPLSAVCYDWEAAGRGTGKNSAIKIRLCEIKKSYDEYFENVKELDNAS